MVIENNLSADGTNKLGSYFNPMIPIHSFVLENPYLFATYPPPALKKNQLIGIYSNETKIINDDDDDIIDIRHNDIIDIRHNDSK